MRIVIAPNSFKNCLDSCRISEAIAAGINDVCPDAETLLYPLADGGDGLLDVLHARGCGTLRQAAVQDPLGRQITAAWLQCGQMAVIEMARASGIKLLQPFEYAPLRASTFGTGLLIKAALDAGCRRIALGLGGSATIDGGAGMLAALGFNLLDASGRALAPGGGALINLAAIKIDTADRRLADTCFDLLVDVENPLLGAQGAAQVFGPQKGATPDDVQLFERALANWACVLEFTFGHQTAEIAGSGAAGGTAAAALAAFQARIVSGAAWLAEQTGLAAAVKTADLVITGEGALDHQTAFGKAPAYVARLAQAAGKPAIALAGVVAPGLDLKQIGIVACRQIAPAGVAKEESIKHAERYLRQAAAAAVVDWLKYMRSKDYVHYS